MALRFPLRLHARTRYAFDAPTFSDIELARELAAKMNATRDLQTQPLRAVRSGRLSAAALLDEIFAHAIALYAAEIEAGALEEAPSFLEENVGARETAELFGELRAQFEAPASRPDAIELSVRLRLANLNPALQTFNELFDESGLPRDVAALVGGVGCLFRGVAWIRAGRFAIIAISAGAFARASRFSG